MYIQKSYQDEGKTAGKLYLTATPIGNLEDMTYRAVRVLREVQWIAAEDTRQTRKLLSHFEIQTRLISYHEHNKRASGPELIRLLKSGDSIALVSDAGLPAICDPGEELVRSALEEGIDVVPVPGANAALSALIMSGLPTERFVFLGFLPRERKHLEPALLELKREKGTAICYESPHRVEKLVEAIVSVLGGQRELCLVRELTKKYEESIRGKAEELLERLKEVPPQGEYVVLIGGATADADEDSTEGTWWKELSPEEHVHHYEQQGMTPKEAIKQAASDRGLPKRELYNQIHQGK